MGYSPQHNRMRPRYNPKPNAKELAHHMRVMGLGCLVCQRDAVVHHILQRSPHKRWRRDHCQVVPLCDQHHVELHANGSELAWQELEGLDLANEAEFLRTESIMEGIL